MLKLACSAAIAVAMMVPIAHAQNCTSPPNNDPVSWWHANGTPKDETTCNPGKLKGSATFGTGFLNQDFFFNGSPGQVAVPQSPSLNPGNAVSVAFWFKSNDATQFSTCCHGLVTTDFFTFGTTSQACNLQGCSGPVIYWAVITNSQTITDSNERFLWVPPTPTGEWHHLAGTYNGNGTGIAIYLDGQLQESATVTNDGSPLTGPVAPMLSTSYLSIGSEDGRTICSDCVGTRYLNGEIDEVKYFNRALSASEVLGIYMAETGAHSLGWMGVNLTVP